MNLESIDSESEKSFLIVGLVRNCAAQLRKDVLRVQRAFHQSRRIQWLLVESDSTDNTIQELEALARELADFAFISLGALRPRMPLRTDRIAYCRNRYVQEIRTCSEYKDVDYVVVADFDGINTLLDKQGVASCWDRSDWDVCTANQRGPYYDVWALRHAVWSPNDCWTQYEFLKPFASTAEDALFAAVYARMIKIPAHSDWVEVESAFGGMAIYRRRAFDEAVYVGLTPQGDEVCEHVPFHAALRAQGYRIFINPQLINAGYTEHTQALLFLNRLRRGVLRLAKASVASISALRA